MAKIDISGARAEVLNELAGSAVDTRLNVIKSLAGRIRDNRADAVRLNVALRAALSDIGELAVPIKEYFNDPEISDLIDGALGR
jgi:hypothetical protein